MKPMGLRARINAKCKDCIYDPLGGGSWRAQVEACTSVECPLFAIRPKVTKKAARAVQHDPDGPELPPAD